MKKTIFCLLVFSLFIIPISIVFSSLVIAAPAGEMAFGGMSANFPENDFRDYWQKAYPEMKKIFGNPYSSFTFTVEGRLDVKDHDGGWDAVNKKVIESEPAVTSYNELLKSSPKAAVNSVLQGTTHELSHAMYTYGNIAVGFPEAWINEGWAKTTELITWLRIKGEPVRPGIYLTEYLDKDTVGGTQGLGRYKQKRNHGLVYDSISEAHMNLLYACSASNSAPDFQKRMDAAIYDDYVVKGKLNEFNKISLEDYKSVIKRLCPDGKVDDVPAIDWYFSQPAAFTNGSSGFQLGMFPHYWAYTTVEGMDVFTFDRTQNTQDEDKTEVGVPAKINVTIFDTKGNKVYSNETITDENGNAVINFGRDFLKDGSYYIVAESEYQSQKKQAKMFFFSLRDRDGTAEEQAALQPGKEVLGILIDKNLKPLDSKYISVLKPLGEAEITGNSNGLFMARVPSLETKEINFDFLGENFTFTKPPFRRLVILKLPDNLIKKAEQEPAFKNFVDNGFAKSGTANEITNEKSGDAGNAINEIKTLNEPRGPPSQPPQKTIIDWLLEQFARLFGLG